MASKLSVRQAMLDAVRATRVEYCRERTGDGNMSRFYVYRWRLDGERVSAPEAAVLSDALAEGAIELAQGFAGHIGEASVPVTLGGSR